MKLYELPEDIYSLRCLLHSHGSGSMTKGPQLIASRRRTAPTLKKKGYPCTTQTTPASQPLQHLCETLPFSGIREKQLQQDPLQGGLHQERSRWTVLPQNWSCFAKQQYLCVLSSDWSNHVVPERLKGLRTLCKSAFGVPQFDWDTSCA